MPGVSSKNGSVYCSTEKYFNCLIHTTGTLGANKRNCKCVEPCNRSSYQSSLSYSAISSLSVETLLSINTAELKRNFYAAEHLKQRIQGDTLVKDLKIIQKTLRNFNALHSYAKVNTLSYEKSIFYKLRKCMDRMTEIYSSDMELLYPILESFYNAYEEAYGTSRLSMRNAFQKAQIESAELLQKALDSKRSSQVHKDDLIIIQKLFNESLSSMNQFRAYIVQYDSPFVLNKTTSDRLPRRQDKGLDGTYDCSKAKLAFEKEVAIVVRSLGYGEIEELKWEFKKSYRDVSNAGKKYIACLETYYHNIIKVEEWKTVKKNSIIKLLSDRGTFTALQNFDFEAEWSDIAKVWKKVEQFLEAYAKHETNKLDNKENLDGTIIQGAISNINKFTSKIETRLVENMRSMITIASKNIKSGYIDAIDRIVDLYPYQSSEGSEILSSIVQNFTLWWRLRANVEEPSQPIRGKLTLQVYLLSFFYYGLHVYQTANLSRNSFDKFPA